jgi:hypothetical protein
MKLRQMRRHRWLMATVTTFVVVLVVMAIYATWVAGSAGVLPWQPEPTRIAVTPFSDIPGFSAPVPTPTPAAPVT